MAGDPRDDEFTWFVRRRGAALRRTAYLLTGDAGRAEDLAQTALVSLWLRRRRVSPESWEPYARRIMVTTSTSWWRRRWTGERPTEALPDRAVAAGTDAVDERALLLDALRRLPPRQRAAVVLRHYSDLSEADTARSLGCSIGTVKSLTSRGLARLRHQLPAEPAARSNRESS